MRFLAISVNFFISRMSESPRSTHFQPDWSEIRSNFERNLFRTSVFPMFLALVEVFGDFRRQIRIQHVELL